MKKIKVYVVMSDAEMLKQCIGVLQEFAEVGLLGFSVDSREGLKKICQLSPDLIVTELAMPYIDGLTLALRCQEQLPEHVPGVLFCYRYKPEVMFALNQVRFVSLHAFPVSNEVLAFQFRQAFLSFRAYRKKEMDGRLIESYQESSLIESAEYSAEEKVRRILQAELDKLGFQTKYFGYKYWVEAVSGQLVKTQLEASSMMSVYRRLAKRYKVSEQSVEKNMRKAISAAWKQGNAKAWGMLFCFHELESEKQPSNSAFLYQLEQYIRRDYFW